MSGGDAEHPAGSREQRLDKWIWFARVVKSRTLAATLVTEGRVRLNRVKATKPSQAVRVGDVLTVTIGLRVRILEVAGIGARRGPASEAQALFLDLTPPREPPGSLRATSGLGVRDAGSGRPTKRDRRQLDRLRDDA